MSALSLRQLTKVYKNGFTALQGIDLDVREGDFFALLGPNGAGKSTTIGIISSLVRKSAGQVFIFGHDIDRDVEAAKRCIGLVPQEVNFNQFEKVLSIVVNQAGYYGIRRREALSRAQECLRQLGLWEKRDAVSRSLSGGMKRRLMIARALVHQPRLLILDEPTAGVDIEIRRSMWEFLRRINAEGTTIILTTHYLEEAENLCRHIAIIDQGRIVEHSDMSSLLQRLGVTSYILELSEAIERVPDLPSFRFAITDARTLRVEVSAEQGLHVLFDALSAQGIKVNAIRSESNRLEQLFINLVGHGPQNSTDS